MFGTAQALVIAIISYVLFGAAIWGLIDAVTAPARAFVSAGKQSKVLWVVLLAVATAFVFVALPAPLGRGGGPFGFLGIASAAVVILYSVWVRPAIAGYRGGKPPRRNDRGGW